MIALVILLHVSAIAGALFVIGSTLTFAWAPLPTALVILSQCALIAVNVWCLSRWRTRRRARRLALTRLRTGGGG